MKNYCLTLPEQPERTERARKHFEEHHIPAEFVQGFNGAKSGLQATHPYNIDNPGTNYIIGPATIGIFISHLMVWSIVAHQDSEHAMIFEDDVIIGDNFVERLSRVVMRDAPPDFDMIFLGSCCTGGHKFQHIKGEVYDVRWPQCLHAYILAKKAARTLLEGYRDVFGPIDCLLALNDFCGLKVYTVLPRMAEQMNTDLPI